MLSQKNAIKTQATNWLKSPGSWFMLANASLNSQTHWLTAAGYLTTTASQVVARHMFEGTARNPVVKFLLGQQGQLALNAAWTLAVAAVTSVYGSPVLAGVGLLFGIANSIQSMVWGGAINFRTENRKNIALNSCEMAIIAGLALVAHNAGFSLQAAGVMAIPGIVMSMARNFRPRWIRKPGLVYADMMVMAVATGIEAAATGNYLNVISRAFAFAGFTRLAANRANSDKVSTVFAVEESIPKLIGKIRRLQHSVPNP